MSSRYRLACLTTRSELVGVADEYDRLLVRSEVALPTRQAGPLGLWLETFAWRRMRILCVYDRDRLIAALPLVESRLRGARVAALPVNCWSSAGDLLLDPEGSAESMLSRLCEGIERLPWSLLLFDTIDVQTPRWTSFHDAALARGHCLTCQPQFEIGIADLERDWSRYLARLSPAHLKKLRRVRRKAEAAGELELRVTMPRGAAAARNAVGSVLEVEHRCWKGRAGSSILSDERITEFFLRQSAEVAVRGQLVVIALTLDGRPIAGEFGYIADHTYFAHKTGYDEAFGHLSPGHLLNAMWLEQCHATPPLPIERFHMMGILDEATARWCNTTVSIGRLKLATRRPGKWLLKAFPRISPLLGGGPPLAEQNRV